MNNKLKIKGLLVIIVLLIITTIIAGYYAFKVKEKYVLITNNGYNEAFFNMIDYINRVENYLAKSTITKSSQHASETLTEVWRDANLAMVYLARIPLSSDGLSQTSKFLNQVSDYSYSLSRKSINNEELTDEDLKNLETLYQYSVALQTTLNQLSQELFDGTVTWSSFQKTESLELAQAVDNVTIYSEIDENLNQYEGLIYDGAYSDHVSSVEKKGLTGDDIDEEAAKTKVMEFFRNDTVESVESNGFIENAQIPLYDFSVKLKDKDYKISISISKKGGHVIETTTDRAVNEEKITQEAANEIGKKYLTEKGFQNMKETYYMKQGNIVTINYAYEENNVIIYPDLIKVKVALDNGEVLGIETAGYLNWHTTRTYENVKLSIEEAKEKLNKNLEILSQRMAIIPTKWKTEILCYEFKGIVKGKEFLVYINAQTGREEDILVILYTPGGTLTM